jgi:hypothetical protein
MVGRKAGQLQGSGHSLITEHVCDPCIDYPSIWLCATSLPPLRAPAAGAEFELDERGQGSATGEQVLERLSFGKSSLPRTMANQGRCAGTGVLGIDQLMLSPTSG